MFERPLGIVLSLALAVPFAAAANLAASTAKLSAAEIVEKNVAARGGLQAWRAVQTMQWSGKMGVGGNQRTTLSMPDPSEKASQKLMPRRPAEEVQLPFTMDLKRTRKMRLELQLKGQTAVQVYDGANGWKLRPFLNRLEVEPYTADEQKKASTQQDLDGPLVDYAAKGTRVELGGIEKVGERDNYNLKLTFKDGQSTHIWIDAETFLETKIEGQPRRMDGTEHPVEVYFRDYRQVNELVIPFVLETKVLPVGRTAMGFKDPPVPVEKIALDNVVVNPKLDDSLFMKPTVAAAANPAHPLHLNN
jgi:outer membrane lipoprotein-sorting protein